MSGMGVYFTNFRPLMIDVQMDASRGVASRTKVNLASSSKNLERSVSRLSSIYSHLARNVNTYA